MHVVGNGPERARRFRMGPLALSVFGTLGVFVALAVVGSVFAHRIAETEAREGASARAVATARVALAPFLVDGVLERDPSALAPLDAAASSGAHTLNFGAVALLGISGIDGGGGNDTITGTAAVDSIFGGAGNDILNGGGGDDLITGGAGNDAMNGGAGLDAFRFDAGFGADTITGFDANPSAGQDKLDVTAMGITAANFATRVILGLSSDGLSTVVTIDGVSSVTVLARTPGAGANQMSITDFTIAT